MSHSYTASNIYSKNTLVNEFRADLLPIYTYDNSYNALKKCKQLRLSSGILFLYFGWAVVLSLEIYFGLSLNARILILLRERFALKQATSSMF